MSFFCAVRSSAALLVTIASVALAGCGGGRSTGSGGAGGAGVDAGGSAGVDAGGSAGVGGGGSGGIDGGGSGGVAGGGSGGVGGVGGSSAGPITPRVTLSRTQGAGPLYVFFDASGTTDPSTTACPTKTCDTFRDLRYTWCFDDAAAPNWKYGTRIGPQTVCSSGTGGSNVAYGPEAAHVFAPPLGSGTTNYNVTLTVTDGTNTVTKYALTKISVTDPNSYSGWSASKTVCISGSGDFTNCPTGAQHVTSSSYSGSVNGSVAARYLLHCGETFTAGANVQLVAAGPAMIGAYDCASKAKPIVRATANGVSFAYFGGRNSPSDWRVVGLDFEANGHTGLALFSGTANTAPSEMLEYDDTMNGVDSTWTVDNATVPHDIGIVGNDEHGITNETWFGWGHGVGVLGNNFSATCCGSGGILNILRFMGIDHAVISDNTVGGSTATGGGSNITIRVHDKNASTDPQAGHIVLSENDLPTGSNVAAIDFTPLEYNTTSEHITEVITERNFIHGATSTTNNGIFGNLVNGDLRDNVIDTSGMGGSIALRLQSKGWSSAPTGSTGDRVLSNTFRQVGASKVLWAVGPSPDSDGLVVKDNLAYGSASGSEMITTAPTGLVESNNTCDGGHSATNCAGAIRTDPSFADSSGNFSAPTDYQLGAGSYARGTGTPFLKWLGDFGSNSFANPSSIGAWQ